ncbi:MAG: SRPBCC domain-containing protein [Bacteroidota bacterium]|nr:MAG: SRPBCC domain-containing protein [Bacteroidota bacterium]
MKEKLVLEYSINSSPKVLFSRFSTPGGLAEWFADDVILKGSLYIFIWDGMEQKAEVVQKKENRYIRFKWIDDPEAYFEFRINVDEITKDVALVVTDMVEPDEFEDTTELWNTQITRLKQVIGL